MYVLKESTGGSLAVMDGDEVVARVQTHALKWAAKPDKDGKAAEELVALPVDQCVIDFCAALPTAAVLEIVALVGKE